MNQNYQLIEIAEYDTYCILTLNRPEKRNALNQVMREEILHFFKNKAFEFEVIILTGSGKGFCAGMDLREQALKDGADHFMQVVKGIYDSDAIFIAAVNGAARGGGLMMINACDYAIGSQKATFGMPDISSKGDPAFSDPNIQKAVREKAKNYLALAGKSIGVEEAQKNGIINYFVPHDLLLKNTEALVNQIYNIGITEIQKQKKENNKKIFDNSLRKKVILDY